MITEGTRAKWASVGLLFILLGCERADPRLEQLAVGISKDSLLQIMGGNPERNDPVLVAGQYIEAMYFLGQGTEGPGVTTDRDLLPIVAINQKVVGWGWTYWDSVAAANGVEVAPPR